MTDDDRINWGTDGDQLNRDGELTYAIGDDERPSEAVVRAVAAFTDTRVLDLDPLYHAIDPDHVDTLLDGSNGAEHARVSFGFNGCAVTVESETVRVTPASEASR